MADFNKPTGTESSDSTIQLQNEKMLAIAKMNYSQYTSNVPDGVISFDATNNIFRKRSGSTWEPINLSLSLSGTVNLDTLTANSSTLTSLTSTNITATNVTIPSGGTITAPQLTTINTRLTTLEGRSFDFKEGTAGNDFNIVANDAGGNSTQNQTGGEMVFNLPDAGPGKRGVITSSTQTIAGYKNFQNGIGINGVELHSTTGEALHIGGEYILTDAKVLFGLPTDPATVTSAFQVAGRIAGTSDFNGIHIGMSEATDSNGYAAIKLCSGLGSLIDFTTTNTEKLARISYTNSSEILKFQSNKISIQSNSSSTPVKVGIGTDTPTHTLSVVNENAAAGVIVQSLNQKLTIENQAGDSSSIQSQNQTTGTATTLTLQPAGGLVGIGTSQPNQKLTIQSSTNTSAAITLRGNNHSSINELFLGQNESGSAYFWQNANLPVIIGTNNQERVRITSGGSVGIGTSTPQDMLHVSGALRLGTSSESTWDTSISRFYTNASGFGARYDAQSHQFDYGTSRNTGLVIDNSGRYGLNTTPFAWNRSLTGATLDVSGNFGMMVHSTAGTHFTQNAYWNASNQWIKKTAGGAGCYLMSSDGGHVWYSGASSSAGSQFSYVNTMGLSVDGILTTRSSISSGGNLSASGNITGVDISGRNINASGSVGVTYNVNVGGSGISWSGSAIYWQSQAYRTGVNGVAGNAISFVWNGSLLASVDNAWLAYVSTPSDYRLKHNFRPVHSATQIIEKLNPGLYEMKNLDGSLLNTTRCGLLAHEVQKILPSLVLLEKDAVAETGGPMYQSLDYSGLIPYLIAAFKEQQETIKNLQQRLSELEEKGTP